MRLNKRLGDAGPCALSACLCLRHINLFDIIAFGSLWSTSFLSFWSDNIRTYLLPISLARCYSSGKFDSITGCVRAATANLSPTNSFFKTLVDSEVTVELKNDIQIKGILKSVDQYLNIKLDDIQVVEELKYPHLVSNRNWAEETRWNAMGSGL